MTPRSYRPRRSLRIEALQLLASAALPAAILYVFPYKALAPVAQARARDEACTAKCAFVTLDQDQERRIVAAAKSAWQVSAEGVRRLRLDMFAEEIPEAALDPVSDIAARTRVLRSPPLPGGEHSPPTDLRAPPPESIKASKEEVRARPAFGRDDMLRIDRIAF
jgi:hypothetical protein